MQREFRDTANRVWRLTVNVNKIRQVRSLTGVYLPDLFDDDMRPLAKLANDPCKLADVLCALLRDQLQTAGVTDEAFGESLGGDSLKAGFDAFLEEMTDFFPQPQAARIRRLLGETRKVEALVQARVDEELAKLDPAALANKLTSSSATAQASSAPIPASGLSES